jgi:large subunit ribosomal protein L24
MTKIKNGTTVKVISGKDKGKIGKVIEIKKKENKVKIQGVALVSKHYKAKKQNEKSEIRVFESFIHISNVAFHESL